MSRVETAVSSITASSGRRPNSEAQNLDEKELSAITEGTRLMTASRRRDLNVNHNRNDDSKQ